jgi:hypothetical protein
MRKKKIFGAKIGVARDILLSFFYARHKNYQFFAKLDACTYNVKMYVLNFYSEFFDVSIILFLVMGAYALMSRIKFTIIYEIRPG